MIYALINATGPLVLVVLAMTKLGLDALIELELARQNGVNTIRKKDHVSMEDYMKNFKRVSILITDLDDNA